jgi:hypothetical protein
MYPNWDIPSMTGLPDPSTFFSVDSITKAITRVIEKIGEEADKFGLDSNLVRGYVFYNPGKESYITIVSPYDQTVMEYAHDYELLLAVLVELDLTYHIYDY